MVHDPSNHGIVHERGLEGIISTMLGTRKVEPLTAQLLGYRKTHPGQLFPKLRTHCTDVVRSSLSVQHPLSLKDVEATYVLAQAVAGHSGAVDLTPFLERARAIRSVRAGIVHDKAHEPAQRVTYLNELAEELSFYEKNLSKGSGPVLTNEIRSVAEGIWQTHQGGSSLLLQYLSFLLIAYNSVHGSVPPTIISRDRPKIQEGHESPLPSRAEVVAKAYQRALSVLEGKSNLPPQTRQQMRANYTEALRLLGTPPQTI